MNPQQQPHKASLRRLASPLFPSPHPSLSFTAPATDDGMPTADGTLTNASPRRRTSCRSSRGFNSTAWAMRPSCLCRIPRFTDCHPRRGASFNRWTLTPSPPAEAQKGRPAYREPPLRHLPSRALPPIVSEWWDQSEPLRLSRLFRRAGTSPACGGWSCGLCRPCAPPARCCLRGGEAGRAGTPSRTPRSRRTWRRGRAGRR
jgi:hypothetical protein